MHRNFSLHMWQAAGGWAVLLSHMRVEDFSPLCTPTKRALSLPNDPLTMLREKNALWAIWTFLCPFLRLTVTWLNIFLDEIVDKTFIVRLSVISRSKARFDPCKITKTSSRSSEAVSHKTSPMVKCRIVREARHKAVIRSLWWLEVKDCNENRHEGGHGRC